MNRYQIEGHWKQLRGATQELWGKLTGNGRVTAAGKHERIAGMRRQEYGDAKARAEKELGALVPAVVPVTNPRSGKEVSRIRRLSLFVTQ
jgi:uncharacterized protein YjbJ (UPF0337 family)